MVSSKPWRPNAFTDLSSLILNVGAGGGGAPGTGAAGGGGGGSSGSALQELAYYGILGSLVAAARFGTNGGAPGAAGTNRTALGGNLTISPGCGGGGVSAGGVEGVGGSIVAAGPIPGVSGGAAGQPGAHGVWSWGPMWGTGGGGGGSSNAGPGGAGGDGAFGCGGGGGGAGTTGGNGGRGGDGLVWLCPI